MKNFLPKGLILYVFANQQKPEKIFSDQRNNYKSYLYMCFSYTPFKKDEQQSECIFCDCPLIWHHIFLDCSDTLPARNLLLNNVQTMRDLLTQANISDFFAGVWFLQQNLKSFILLHFYIYLHFYTFTFIYISYTFMLVGRDYKCCSVSRITTP